MIERMGITYTDNLHLGLQEDKTETLDWDVLMDNFVKIDAAINAYIITYGNTVSICSGAVHSICGDTTIEED